MYSQTQADSGYVSFPAMQERERLQSEMDRLSADLNLMKLSVSRLTQVAAFLSTLTDC